MKLENQVSSLELSKRLQELGVKQESLFCWCGEGKHIKIMLNSIYDSECNPHLKICSAFTVAELGEIIPKTMLFEKRRSGEWICIDNLNPSEHFSDLKEADARAKMLIYLLEKGLLKNDNLHPGQ